MANPIKKDELVTSEALEQLNQMATTLTTIADNLTKAKTACQGWVAEEGKSAAATGDNVETLTKMLNKITDIENAIKALNKAEKENNETLRTVNAERRKYAKLTEEEAERVRHLSEAVEKYIKYTNSQVQSLRGLADIYGKTVVEIDMQKKSYNELYQTYNVIKDALNKMTLEERLNTEAGKMMTAQALKIRDSLNELQKSTGNYTLQVGKYRAAFDGLGYSIQQVLREAPSALNLQQFFLAISNNIPLVVDQMKAFREEQKAIAENLKNMTEGTKEYMEQQAKQMSLGTKLLKSVFSWQTALLAGLFLLRKLPEWIKKARDRAAELAKEWKNVSVSEHTALTQMQNDTIEATRAIENELIIIVNRLGAVTQGSEEWRRSVARINELTNGTLKDINATPDEIRKVTQAYIEQAKQIATNSSIIKQISSFDLSDIRKQQIRSGEFTAEEIAMLAGKTGDEKFIERAQKFLDARQNFQSQRYKELEKARNRAAYGSRDRRRVQREMNKLAEGYTSFDRELDLLFVSGTEKARRALIANYVPIATEKDKNGPKGSVKEPSLQDWKDRYWEMEEARIATMEEGYAKEMELERVANEKALEQNEIAWDTQKEALETNLSNHLITTEEYAIKIEQSKEQHDKIQEYLELEHQRKINDIYNKYQLKRDEEVIKSIENRYKNELKISKRRVKTVEEEKQHNATLIYNIRKLEAEQDQLRQSMETMGKEGAEKTQEKIDKLTESIKKYRSQLKFDKQLSNYTSFWDILQRNGAFDTDPSTMQDIARNLLGDIADSLDPEQIEQIFDQWLQNAGKAISQWYSTTMGYINDLINAYIELANAKAEAAREATEAAQEEYEKEKALLEAGYASRMETMWGEYMEKKRLQEQAEEDAKKAEQAQRMLNELQTVSSLITASANMYKIMSALGPIGIPLATLAVGSMFAAFVAAKAKAAEAAKYGDGDVQVVGGGSHASGHDTLLGYSLQGREMKVENGEVVGIIPRRSVRRIGEQNVLSTMRALRDGTFEANAVKMMGIERNAGMVTTMMMPRTDLRRLERGVDSLVSYGKNNTYVDAQGNIIERSDYGTTKYIRR